MILKWENAPSPNPEFKGETPRDVARALLQPPPVARFQGELMLGDTSVDCYVLETGERIISLRATVRALAQKDHGRAGDYTGITALKPFINKELVAGDSRTFLIPGNPNPAKGITAEQFLEICTAYVRALEAGTLSTKRQAEIAVRCSIILASCAKVGLIALIDEATGYQYVRADDALQLKLKAFIADELREWEKTFPDELWYQFGRLTNWEGSLHLRPKWWGKLVLELVYHALDQDIADYLRENKPPPRKGLNYHQWMTQNYGLNKLVAHIWKIVGIAETCQDMRELRDRVAEKYGREPVQLTMYFPRQL